MQDRLQSWFFFSNGSLPKKDVLTFYSVTKDIFKPKQTKKSRFYFCQFKLHINLKGKLVVPKEYQGKYIVSFKQFIMCVCVCVCDQEKYVCYF